MQSTSHLTAAPLDLVPPEILERPPRDVLRHVEKDEAALIVDTQLRSLARHEAACRRGLGAIAAAFLRRSGHHALGFARLADYTRERLGLSAREVQSAAQVVSTLAGLPAIAAAFNRGELSWTQLRLLTATATASTETMWLMRAQGLTVRALEALIRGGRGSEGSASRPARVDAALSDCAEDAPLDGEAAGVVRMQCPARVRTAWRETVELASRVAGERLTPWQAAEAMAAEGLAGASTADRTRALGLTEIDAASDPARAVGAAPGGAGADPDERLEVFARASGFGELDWRSVVVTLPAAVDAVARDLDGLGPAALDARLRQAVRALQRLDWQAGRLLRLCFDLRLYRILGFSSAARYVRERLGLSTGKAAALVAVERRLCDVPALGDAYREGQVSWLRALTLLPVLSERHATAWIARASEITLRRLAAEIRWALDQQDCHRPFAWIAPPPPNATLERPTSETTGDIQMRAHWTAERCDGAISFRGPESVVVLFQAAVEAFRSPGQPNWTGLLALLDHIRAEWGSQPRHRDPVFARDGWQCTVPACSSRRNLHDHHVRYRSRGGDNLRSNRTTVCEWHHLHGIHESRVQVWGVAPGALRWALGVGVGPDGRPFLRLNGDRYVKGGERQNDRDGTTRAA